MGEVAVEVIRTTQASLGKIIKKPPLTDKLLRKPPFRFLHDIVTNVINTTGFMKDVFTAEELVSDNIKDKESKINFLQKVIDVVSSASGDKLSVRPNKVVAGHDADKTNELLQALAKAIQQGTLPCMPTENFDTLPMPTCRECPPEFENVHRFIRKHPIQNLWGVPSEGISQVKSDKSPVKNSRNESQDRRRTREAKDKNTSNAKDTSKRGNSQDRSNRRESDRRNGLTKDIGDHAKSRDSKSNKEKSRPIDVRKERSQAKNESEVKSRADRIRERSQENKSPTKKDSTKSPRLKASERVREKNKEVEVAAAVISDAIEIPNETEIIEMTGDGSPRKIDSEGDVAARPSSVRPGTAKLSSTRPPTTRPPTSVIRKPLEDEKIEEMTTTAITTTEEDDKQSVNNIQSPVDSSVAPVPSTSNEEPLSRPTTSLGRLRTARPASARPPPPVVRSRKTVIEEPIVETSKLVANVIIENDKDAEEDSAFVVEEPLMQPEPEDLPPAPVISTDPVIENAQHGSLVSQILETKKDLNTINQAGTKRVEIDKSMMSDTSRKKEHDLVTREIDKMRSSIQLLTRSVNPLGKMIDYLQEDMDSMYKELEMWHKENQFHVQALKHEHSNLENMVEPLRNQLSELDQAIQDQLDKISAVKGNILRNEQKIQKMLSGTKS